MIQQRTVLILGAGASVEYGYPTGRDLRNHLIRELEGRAGGDSKNTFRNMLTAAGFDIDEISVFCQALLYSKVSSIDEFLEKREKQFGDLGKAAIFESLTAKENLNRLMKEAEDDWYEYLLSKITGDCDFAGLGENKLTVVTFNYDRSLEEYLFRAISNQYGENMEAVAKTLGEIPIIHLHGSLGPLPWQDKDNGRAYGRGLEPKHVRHVSKSIKVVHEATSDEDFAQAKSVLAEAERIVFLGFGYHHVSLERLFKDVQLGTNELYGTFYGFTRLEMNDIKKRLDGVAGKPINNSGYAARVADSARILNLKILDYLREVMTLD